MRNIKIMLLFLLTFFTSNIYVYASCTNDDIQILISKAKDIKVTYKHLGLLEEEDGNTYYNSFDVTIKNIYDDFYLSVFENDTNKLIAEDGTIKITLDTGSWDLKVYSSKCNVLIDTISFRLPRFNIYSLDPLCDGIDGEDFKLCGKYFDSYVTYNDFVTSVNYYRTTHDIDEDAVFNDNNKKNIFVNIIDFIAENKMYFIIGLSGILFIFFIILIIKKKRKRGVLE